MADVFRLVGAVDTIQRVLVAFVKVDRPRTERISRTARNAFGVRTEPGLDLRRGDRLPLTGVCLGRKAIGGALDESCAARIRVGERMLWGR